MKILIFLAVLAYTNLVLSQDGKSRVWDRIGYKRQRILNSQDQALQHIQDPKVKAIVSHRIDQINKRIPFMSNFHNAQDSYNNGVSSKVVPGDNPRINYKREEILNSQKNALDHIEDPEIKSIVANRIDRINNKIPIMSNLYDTHDSSNNVPGITYRRQKIVNSQKNALDHIEDPQIKSIVANRINTINKKIPIMSNLDEIPNSLKLHERKIEELQNSEKIALNNIEEPLLKHAVRNRIDEENKSVPFLKGSNDIDARFSNALDAIHERMNEIKKSQRIAIDNIKDAALRETVLKRINEENKILSKKATEIDAKLMSSLNTIHKRMAELKDIEVNTLEGIEDFALKEKVRERLEKQNNKIPHLLMTSEIDDTARPIAEISSKIDDLEYSEYKALEQVEDPEMQAIVLNSMFEHNKEIPVLLKSSDVDAKFTTSLQAVRSRINAEIEKSNNVPLDAIIDPSIKDLILNRIAVQNQKRVDIAKEIEANLTVSFNEIHNRIAALKKSENEVVDNIADPNEKIKVLNQIDEQYEKIPTLLLPGLIDLKFANALGAFNTKMEGLKNTFNLISSNITDPSMQAAMEAKMNFVNYKLMTKYNQIKNNFTTLLAAKTEDNLPADDDLAEEVVKVPHLMKTFDPDTDFSLIQAEIQKKLESKKIPTDILLGGITDPAIKAAIINKLDIANEKIRVKVDAVNANISASLTDIRTRIAALKALEDETVQSISDPAVKEAVSDGIDEHNKKIPQLLLPFGIDANFTKALDAFHAKIDDLKNTVDVATENITIPEIKTMVLAKLDFVHNMLLKKYDQLDSNFTTILATIQERFSNLTSDEPTTEVGVELAHDVQKVPVLTKTLDDVATNFSRISGIIHSKIEGGFANISLIGIMNPAIRALITDKLNERSKNMSEILDKIDANLTKSLEAIQNQTAELQKLETLTLDNIDDPAIQEAALSQIEEENKKIPVLLASKRSDKKKPEVVIPNRNIFRVRFPSVIRF